MKQLIYVVVGPTASGKSAYAVELARRLNGEVISADSRQVYRGLTIGSGKITKKEMRGVPHHMLDVANPRRTFTAHDYVQMARPILEDILARGKTPIICGGTGFYIDALLDRTSFANVAPNPTLRKRLASKATPELFSMLQKQDPRRAASIDRHNPVRLIRALEIVAALGHVPKNHGLENKGFVNPYIRWIGLRPSNDVLRKKIALRLRMRLNAGMVAEAKRLHARGLSYKRMEELGLEYRFLARLLQSKISRSEFMEQLESEIWQYARRQMTYWRRNMCIVWT